MSASQPRRDSSASPEWQVAYPPGYLRTPEEVEADEAEARAERVFADYWGGEGEIWEAQAAEFYAQCDMEAGEPDGIDLAGETAPAAADRREPELEAEW